MEAKRRGRSKRKRAQSLALTTTKRSESSRPNPKILVQKMLVLTPLTTSTVMEVVQLKMLAATAVPNRVIARMSIAMKKSHQKLGTKHRQKRLFRQNKRKKRRSRVRNKQLYVRLIFSNKKPIKFSLFVKI